MLELILIVLLVLFLLGGFGHVLAWIVSLPLAVVLLIVVVIMLVSKK